MLGGLDTVEEFWTWRQVQLAMEAAHDGSLDEFRNELAHFFDVPARLVRLAPGGRQALEWLLRNRTDPRRIVMVPAFNCSVVEEAAAIAGYQVQLYDFSPRPGIFDWKQVVEEMGPSVGTLVVTHYFGVPVDFRSVRECCAAKGIAVIEDCAHTLGGMIAGRPAGTWGDAAIFSFNYDKPISLGWGGFALVNNSTAFDVEQPMGFRIPARAEEFTLLKKFMAAMAWRRRMIRFDNTLALRAMRRAGLGRLSEFRKDANISIGSIQAELGRRCLAHYPGAVSNRNATAKRISTGIAQACWPVEDCVTPAWLKQKVRITGNGALRRVSMNMQKKGVRLGNFNWPELLKSGQEGSHFPIAADAATHWVDVPVHQNLTDVAIEEVIQAMKSLY